MLSREFAPGGALDGRDADLVGAVIVGGMLGLTVIVAMRTWFTTGVFANAQIASLAGAPIYILVIVGFLTRERAAVPPRDGEILIPFVSAISPAVALNVAQLISPQWGSPFGYAIAAAGIGISIAALVSLRRSFAVLPAVRKVVTAGPYRLIRHPLYLGESLFVIGFVLLAASWANLLALAVVVALLAWRITLEERKLLAVEEYATYARQVRSRLVPGIW